MKENITFFFSYCSLVNLGNVDFKNQRKKERISERESQRKKERKKDWLLNKYTQSQVRVRQMDSTAVKHTGRHTQINNKID